LPAATPVTVCTFTTAILEDVQMPPEGNEPRVAKEPAQIDAGPDMVAGSGLSVMLCVRTQPVVVSTYDIVTVPAASALTEPDVDPMVASAGLLLTQVPFIVRSARVVLLLTQSVDAPITGTGAAFTVTTAEEAHVVGSIY
jgi:hypothetical protein